MRWQRVREAFNQSLDAVSLRIWRWDHRCLEYIHQQPKLKRASKLFVTFTYFGDGYLWLAVLVGLSVFGTSSDRRRALIMVIITSLNIVMFRISKRLAKRIRPDSPAAVALRFRYLDSYSFPSGHATTAFGMATMLSGFYPFAPVQIAAFSAAALISFSRIYVGEHYPSDVLIGAALGVLVSSLLLPVFEYLLLG